LIALGLDLHMPIVLRCFNVGIIRAFVSLALEWLEEYRVNIHIPVFHSTFGRKTHNTVCGGSRWRTPSLLYAAWLVNRFAQALPAINPRYLPVGQHRPLPEYSRATVAI